MVLTECGSLKFQRKLSFLVLSTRICQLRGIPSEKPRSWSKNQVKGSKSEHIRTKQPTPTVGIQPIPAKGYYFRNPPIQANRYFRNPLGLNWVIGRKIYPKKVMLYNFHAEKALFKEGPKIAI